MTEEEERILKEGKGRGTAVIKIQSQAKRVNKTFKNMVKYLTIYFTGLP